ncbi:flagellar biosynthesis protein FlhF [Candidatus Epulonipiscium fishelsonii]|uniref:Flagellar biosynthesis protein FlhF n=1 Tax=Candidatus Epulonipiscium fishelsonii TaxID=77094 RepID=A0ACC8XEJ3_9FIRM|nr:flagellar biosynthesis protein FlhF [Epulopiscium sp. SCG-D08WGA-EpuloA1]
MRILKVTGRDELSLQEQIKKEYGDKAIIITSQEEKKKNLFGIKSKSVWNMTIAVEDNEVEILPPLDLKVQDNRPKRIESRPSVEARPKAKEQNYKVEYRSSIPRNPQAYSKIEPEPQSGTVGMLRKILKEEGIEDEVLEEIFSKAHGDDLDSVSRSIYHTLNKLMPKFHHDLPKINFFIGPTGVGKTTTIAKLTALKVLQEKKKIVLLTADTYRIAAVEQLRTYADILGVPIETIYDDTEIEEYLEKWQDVDHIFIDTAGRSHKNLEQLSELERLLLKCEEKQIFLVLNMSTAYRDIQNIVDIYEEITTDFALIITKLDETDAIGNLMNITFCTKKPIAYITTGQNVPNDIEKFENLQYVKLLIGRLNYE